MFLLKRLKSALIFSFRKNLLKRTKAIVVVSSGRTGTKFFERLFKEINPSSIVFHEPSPDFFDLGVKKVRFNESSGIIRKTIIHQRGKLINAERVNRGLKNELYVESNPFLFPILNEFSSVFKTIKLIYIIRDPKTYLISAFNKDPQNDRINDFYAETDKRKRLTASDYDELSNSEWNKYSREEKIAWYWSKTNEILFAYYLQNKDKAVLIRYEDLFSKSTKTRKRNLIEILSLSYPDYNLSSSFNKLLSLLDVKINRSVQLSDIMDFEDFDDATKLRIEKIIAPMAKKLGYDI